MLRLSGSATSTNGNKLDNKSSLKPGAGKFTLLLETSLGQSYISFYLAASLVRNTQQTPVLQ